MQKIVPTYSHFQSCKDYILFQKGTHFFCENLCLYWLLQKAITILGVLLSKEWAYALLSGSFKQMILGQHYMPIALFRMQYNYLWAKTITNRTGYIFKNHYRLYLFKKLLSVHISFLHLKAFYICRHPFRVQSYPLSSVPLPQVLVRCLLLLFNWPWTRCCTHSHIVTYFPSCDDQYAIPLRLPDSSLRNTHVPKQFSIRSSKTVMVQPSQLIFSLVSVITSRYPLSLISSFHNFAVHHISC